MVMVGPLLALGRGPRVFSSGWRVGAWAPALLFPVCVTLGGTSHLAGLPLWSLPHQPPPALTNPLPSLSTPPCPEAEVNFTLSALSLSYSCVLSANSGLVGVGWKL